MTTASAATADLVALTRTRAKTYGLISRLYNTEVDQACLDMLSSMRYPVSSGNAQVDEGYRHIAHFMSNVWTNTLLELAVDYTRTFIGHGNDGYSAAYPFESVYTSERRLLMQEARDEVLAIFRSQGLDKSESWPESEDHVGLELEFMQVMADRAADALESGDEDEAVELFVVQRNFLEDHLYAWTPMLTADMRKIAETELYQGLACLTDGFLETEHELLADLLASVETPGQGEPGAPEGHDGQGGHDGQDGQASAGAAEQA